MTNLRRWRAAAVCTLLGAAALTATLVLPHAQGQPQNQTQGQSQSQSSTHAPSEGRSRAKANDQPADPAAVRERFQRRLEESKRNVERFQEAIQRLDAGEPADKVVKDAARQGADDADAALTPEERARIQKFMQQHMPRLFERFTQADKESPERAQVLLKRMRGRFRELMDLETKDPGTFEVRLDEMRTGMYMWEAARELRVLKEKGGSADAIAIAESKLKSLVTQNVDAHLKVKAHELEVLGDRLGNLRKDLDAQTADREKVIQQRTRRLMSAGDKSDKSNEPK